MNQHDVRRRLRREGVVLSQQAGRLLVRPPLEQLPGEVAAVVRHHAASLLAGAELEPPDRLALARASTVRGWSEARRELFSGVLEALMRFGFAEVAAEKRAFDWARSLVQPLAAPAGDDSQLSVGVEGIVDVSAGQQGAMRAGDDPGPSSSAGPSAALLASRGLRVNYVTTLEDAQKAVAEILDGPTEWEPFGLDIETMPVSVVPGGVNHVDDEPLPSRDALNPHTSSIRLVQVFPGGRDVHVFDLRGLGIETLAPIWGRSFVAHNAAFEMKHLVVAGCSPTKLHCTYLAEHAITGRSRSLEELTGMLAGWQLSKVQQTSDWASISLSEEQLAYAAVDAVATWKCWRALNCTKEFQRARKVYDLEVGAVPAVAAMETAGIRLDEVAHRELLSSLCADRELAEQALHGLLGADVNIRSAKQLSEALQGMLQADWPRTKSGLVATDRQALLRGGDVPVCKALLSFRATDQLCKTFGSSLLDSVQPTSGRLHPSFNLAGTVTGRLTASRPNVQQIPARADKRFRSLFVPASGNVFVVGDYSQIELRAAALLSGDSVMRAAYENGDDLHLLTAAAITGKSPEEVTPDERAEAKAANFGPLYGQKAAGLREKLFADFGKDVSLADAEGYLSAFFARYPELARYLEQVSSSAFANGYSSTQMGRRRWFTNADGSAYSSREAPQRVPSQGRRRPDPWRRSTAVNTPIQGSAAEVNLRALARVHAALDASPTALILNVHDEFVLECPESVGKEAKALLEREMRGAFLDIFPDGEPVSHRLVDAVVAGSWGEAK